MFCILKTEAADSSETLNHLQDYLLMTIIQKFRYQQGTGSRFSTGKRLEHKSVMPFASIFPLRPSAVEENESWDRQDGTKPEIFTLQRSV
jgi:hypothetical protein